VVKAGTIVEQGTHEELQAAGGAYAALIAMQQSDPSGSLPGSGRASLDLPAIKRASVDEGAVPASAKGVLETVLETKPEAFAAAAKIALPVRARILHHLCSSLQRSRLAHVLGF
jgi:hypothetical protein